MNLMSLVLSAIVEMAEAKMKAMVMALQMQMDLLSWSSKTTHIEKKNTLIIEFH